ncbi:hypothetical protein EGW08_005689 [Elysia chlorotica]|uniref:Mos1 transposase HTH domain-containing protein n=1 Tax=Elysia chlorotica TaxID=188477 RepID=A0A433TYD5_ELYCH|nr:hypothetical protein EGW08_005689 [Elysia chlorotica]
MNSRHEPSMECSVYVSQESGLLKQADGVAETAEICRNGTATANNDTPTLTVSNNSDPQNENSNVDEASGQIIKFEGDLRDYTSDKRRLSPQKASERALQYRMQRSPSYGGNDSEELLEQPSSLSEALLQPPHSSRNRLKSLAMAVSRSLPNSPRFRFGQNQSNMRHSQSAFNDYWSSAGRLKDKSEDARKVSTGAEIPVKLENSPTFFEQEDRVEERPRSTSPTRPNTSQIAMSSVRSVKTIVTQSTSIIDVSNGTTSSSMFPVKRQTSVRSFSSSALPRSTSTPGLASQLTATPVMGRSMPVSATAASLRELRGQPWSLSRADSLADLNDLQHCIVCRACSSRAKQIRPGRHFVLSWKQIIALIFALSLYIAGGTVIFIQLEYPAESKRQDNFIRFFEGFVENGIILRGQVVFLQEASQQTSNNSCVDSGELLHVADTILKDPKLAILLLREINMKSPANPGRTDNVNVEANNSASIMSKKNTVRPDSGFLCPHINDSTEELYLSNCTKRKYNVRVWNAANSMGFVISALTTIEDKEGRPTSVVTEKNVSTVEGLVKQDRRITVKQLASETRISVGSVEKILHDHLNLNKVSARWVPRLLTADQKKERADCCKHLLRLEANDDLFFQKIVTMGETWIYQFDPEPKNASMQWKRPSSPPPKKAKVTQSSGKVMLSCFWDCEGIIMTDYMEKGKTITGEYYSGLLKRLRSELVRRRRGKLRNGVLLLHDNAPAHRARQAVETADLCGYEILRHPPYSPDLAPSDFCLFPNLKKSIKGRRFEDIEDAISAVEEWFQRK